MARGGSRKHRQRRTPVRVSDRLRREDELVTELHALDRAVGVRNGIIARLGRDHLTADERADLAEFRRAPWDIDAAAADLRDFYAWLDAQ